MHLYRLFREKKRQRDEAKRKRRELEKQLKHGSQVIRPPVIQQKPPPFELPNHQTLTNHQSGLTGPIFKHEELVKHSSETELFNQAYLATQKVFYLLSNQNQVFHVIIKKYDVIKPE